MQLTDSYKIELCSAPKHSVMDHFVRACEQGSLPVIRYLLTASELPHEIDIHAFDDYALVAACLHGHLPVLKYLIESDELTERAHVHSQHYNVFQCACRRRHASIVKYLLSLRGEHRIDFQSTPFNLEWALKQKYHTAIKGMMLSLKEYDYFQYVENLARIQTFCRNNKCMGMYEVIIKENDPSYDGHEIAISL